MLSYVDDDDAFVYMMNEWLIDVDCTWKCHNLVSDHWMNIVINCCSICCPPDSSQCCVHWSKIFHCRVLIKWYNGFTGFRKKMESNQCRWKGIYLYKNSLHVYVFVTVYKNCTHIIFTCIFFVYVNLGFCVQYNYCIWRKKNCLV